MINRENALWVAGDAARLLHGANGKVSRALRRFLTGVVDGRFVFQSFAFDEGYSTEQLRAIADYATRVDGEQQPHLSGLPVKRLGTASETSIGCVSNGYELPFEVTTGTLKQLQQAVQLVAVLAEMLKDFAGSPASVAGFNDYHYRGLPCSIASDDKLWSVGGHDKRGGSGVLEWCYDEDDARERVRMMRRYPERFTGLRAEPHRGRRVGMHWAVAQAVSMPHMAS